MSGRIYAGNDPAVASILARAFPGSRPAQVTVQAAETVALSGRYWDEGSKSEYAVVALNQTGRLELGLGGARDAWSTQPPDQEMWDGKAEGAAKTSANVAVVRKNHFHCRDYFTVFFHPDAMPPVTEVKVELSNAEGMVLACTVGIKSQFRKTEAARHNLSGRDYEAAKASLIKRGLLKANGAATVEARNVIGSRRAEDFDPELQARRQKWEAEEAAAKAAAEASTPPGVPAGFQDDDTIRPGGLIGSRAQPQGGELVFARVGG